jgi:hypothetical protein
MGTDKHGGGKEKTILTMMMKQHKQFSLDEKHKTLDMGRDVKKV